MKYNYSQKFHSSVKIYKKSKKLYWGFETASNRHPYGKSRKLKVLVATLLSFTFSLSTAFAQESVNATGGNASGSGGSMSYSVGQVVYSTNTGSNGSVAQGVQQPYEISVVTQVEEATNIQLSMLVYPNPTTESVVLNIGTMSTENIHLSMFDVNGKLLHFQEVISSETIIDMKSYSRGVYFLKVNFQNRELKSFKIVKN
jgi:hypothetical protein